jgi:hypothetical protein
MLKEHSDFLFRKDFLLGRGTHAAPRWTRFISIIVVFTSRVISLLTSFFHSARCRQRQPGQRHAPHAFHENGHRNSFSIFQVFAFIHPKRVNHHFKQLPAFQSVSTDIAHSPIAATIAHKWRVLKILSGSYDLLGLVFGIQRFYHVDSLQRADQREA